MTTNEGNLLIAYFMGGKLIDHPELNGVKMWTKYPLIEGRLNLPTLLQYHTSWDWIMPVIDKIEHLGGSIVILKHCSSVKFTFGGISQEFYENTKILSTWKAILAYIKWHNKNQQK